MTSRTANWIRTGAMLLVLLWFFTGYHVVLMSDDLTQVQALRKEHLGLADSVIVVPRWVDRYNAASPAEQRKLEESYILRRLRETGMVERR